ncbi:MAG: transcription-repair coupling factor, partial [Firmicutes bacterium]|nr:transcription-repair coupling factor [Bacillota bacterium]
RTLHMAMVGVRDMSVIETPPEDRYPIRTYVVEYDEQIIEQAIRRELARDGQVYFVYNRVQGIERIYNELQELVPEARIAIAHGQMDEAVLERVMLDFYNGEFDILLCTTIIETGMDIPNVNTLIVYDADHLGLAQLYQLRGRVGRTNRVAYAYFTHRKDKILSEDAEKRLQAIKEFTELGSGIKIAMRDLEIRGAGNILGPEQHGFITSVGFEMYCRLLEESIRELKGEVEQAPPEPVFDLEVDAYISDEYVPDPKQKVELYKRIIAVTSLDECDDLEEEIQDRFGDLPTAVRNLLQVARAKVLAKFVGVSSVSVQRGAFVIKLLEGLSLDNLVYSNLMRRFRGQVVYRHGRIPQLRLTKAQNDEESLVQLVQVLQFMHEGLEQVAEGKVAGRNE